MKYFNDEYYNDLQKMSRLYIPTVSYQSTILRIINFVSKTCLSVPACFLCIIYAKVKYSRIYIMIEERDM